jgi:tetratricopeptide (TPR) repeat protein
MMAGNLSAANHDFQFALKKDTLNPKAYYYIGLYKHESNDFEGAISSYTKAITLDSNYSLAYYERAKTYQEIRDYTNAQDDFTTAIDLNPNHLQSYIQRAKMRVELGEFHAAILDLTKSIQMDSKNIELYKLSASAKTKLEMNTETKKEEKESLLKEAIFDLSTAHELDPKDANILILRGELRFKSNDKNGACIDWKNATNLGNKDALRLIENNCN